MEDSESQIRRYEFKKALNELTKLHGRGTELISLYIPPDKQISDVVQYLREEFSELIAGQKKYDRVGIVVGGGRLARMYIGELKKFWRQRQCAGRDRHKCH